MGPGEIHAKVQAMLAETPNMLPTPCVLRWMLST